MTLMLWDCLRLVSKRVADMTAAKLTYAEVPGFENQEDDPNELQDSSSHNKTAGENARHKRSDRAQLLSIDAKCVRQHNEDAGTDECRTQNSAQQPQESVRRAALYTAEKSPTQEAYDFQNKPCSQDCGENGGLEAKA
ncbi:hypothetical protein S7711_10797 [Stachybotrys chartarum IBT 7711]|uniref:Uncharacterized protein n=1 Tax=Stachybotrys chartarum (strain CBS 109288 / IBT 7711) TaxID=1280523 RepID=A0A084AXH0_STACB|nr:hypothetical protein S7711_10797 [Stachybotrys chartarum IBT 7711]KFA50798.1 hypothetical protein S40293_11031 [Stachybotrys chartarum IBT 40293]